jgi:putative salt-induced outer membrane protein YdiY
VATSGNSESNTFGLSATLLRVWARSEAKFEGGGLRTESTLKTRTAIGTGQNDFALIEEKKTEKTAENYYLRGRYDYDVSPRFFVFGGVDWLRNVFAGIDSRFLWAGGAGNTWANTEKVKFKTDYSATYTFETEVVENPFVKTNFPGARVAYDLLWRISGSTDFTSVVKLDWNLDNTDDVRTDMTNSLPIQISSKLAMKPSHQLLWRNAPALTSVDLFPSAGAPPSGTVLVPLEEVDSFWKLALVVKL